MSDTKRFPAATAAELPASNLVEVKAECDAVINYVADRYHKNVLRSLTVTNHSDKTLNNLAVKVSAKPEFEDGRSFAAPLTRMIDRLEPGKSVRITDTRLILDVGFLDSLNEKLPTALLLEVYQGEELLYQNALSVDVQPLDEWPSHSVGRQTIACYVTPNHPVIAEQRLKMDDFMGSDRTKGAYYLGKAHVLKLLGAIYNVVAAMDIPYSPMQACFENSGQRVRMVDRILEQKHANCVEMTTLFAALMEACGLHPITVSVTGHMFVGCWLEDTTHKEMICSDVSVAVQNADAGTLLVIECTNANADSHVSFEKACQHARNNLTKEKFRCFVDIKRCRASGILPLPTRVKQQDGTWRMVVVQEAEVAPAVVVDEDPVPQVALTPREEKWGRWEHELMNLGLGNDLVNLNPKNTLPLPVHDPEALVELASQGCQILPLPEEWEQKGWTFRDLDPAAERTELLKRELAMRRLRTLVGEEALAKLVRELNRNADKAMQETGIHTLHLAVGVLCWQDKDRTKRTVDRNAPIVLYPVEVSVKNNTVHLRRVGDGEVNETLVEKLRQSFDIDLRSLLQLENLEGENLTRTMNRVKKAIVGMSGWQVIDGAVLGNFSFSSYAQYTELHDNREEITAHSVSGSLLEGKLRWKPCRLEEDPQINISGREPVLTRPLDPSQRFAVKAAGTGKAFLMFGPPGTGKSETISGMIEDGLYRGRSILFVAGEAVAQEAVLRRLQEKELDSYCLVLRPGSAGKQYIIRQLQRAADRQPRRSNSVEHDAQRRRLDMARNVVRDYYSGLYGTDACGASLYTLIDVYETCRRHKGLHPGALPPAQALTRRRLQRQEKLLEDIVFAAQKLEPATHPLRFLAEVGTTDEDRADIRDGLTAYMECLEALDATARRFADALGARVPRSYENLGQMQQVARKVAPWAKLPHNFGDMAPEEYFDALDALADCQLAVEEQERQLYRCFRPELNEEAADELLEAYEDLNRRPNRNLVNRLQKFARVVLTRDTAVEPLEQLRRWKQARLRAGEQLSCVGDGLDIDDARSVDWNAFKHMVQDCRSAWKALEGVVPAFAMKAAVSDPVSAKRFARVYDAAVVNPPRCLRGLESGDDWISQRMDQCRQVLDNLARLPQWGVWMDLRRQARELELDVIPGALEEGAAVEAVVNGYRKSVTGSLMERIVAGVPALKGYRDLLFHQAVENVYNQQQRLQALSRDEIGAQVDARLDMTREAGENNEANQVQRWLKNPRAVSVRRLFESAPGVLRKMCPCVMVTPQALATYLPYVRGEFDTVIFDEASQLTAAESVAAISRGKEPQEGGSIVICGDPQQMPPARYFAAAQQVESDDLELVDLESVLDECIALNMPKTTLMYHYRSRHEDLIAFSNHAFYDGRLITMPGVSDGTSHVKLVQVNGVYGRGGTRCNPAEAEAIVQELKRRCRDEKLREQSIGIITMNVQQRTLVEKLLAQACAEDEDLVAWLQSAREKLFVQNLESVQGNERDVILLSLNYGPGEDGQLSLSFGPLTKEGGYRRFNVAISRAREEMLVYSSLNPEDISQRKTTSRGMLALRDFLRYAQTGVLPASEAGEEKRPENHVADSLCAALAEAGYEVRRDLGRSGFRIHAAVVDPRDSGRYVLGILLDEPGNLDQDELARQLERREWKIFRLRYMDWLNDPKLVLEELRKKLTSLTA